MSQVKPFFNELSLREVTKENLAERIQRYASLLNQLKTYGIRKVLYEVDMSKVKLADSLTLEELYASAFANPEYSSLMNALLVLLDMREYPSNVENNKRYDYYADVKLATTRNGEVSGDDMPLGLYAAHVMDTFAVGFGGNSEGNESIVCKLLLTKTGQSEQEGDEKCVFCITSKSDCDNDDFSNFLALKDIDVPKATRKIENISLPHHHSLQVCTEHAKILIKDDYVEEILDSLPFVERWEYVHQVYGNGIIHVRIFWERGGYGLKVATSGRDLVQTKWIANHLTSRYGHG